MNDPTPDPATDFAEFLTAQLREQRAHQPQAEPVADAPTDTDPAQQFHDFISAQLNR